MKVIEGITFKDIRDFEGKVSLTGEESLQISKFEKTTTKDIAALSQNAGLVISILPPSIAFLLNSILMDIRANNLNPSYNRLYISKCYNGSVLAYDEYISWGLSLNLEKLDTAEVIEDYVQLNFKLPITDPNIGTYIPYGTQDFDVNGIQATINWDNLVKYSERGTMLAFDTYLEAGILSSQLYSVTSELGNTDSPISQEAYTKGIVEYNINTYAIGGGSVSLGDAIKLVPNYIRRLGLKITFLTDLIFSEASELPTSTMSMTYMYIGKNLESDTWLDLNNWYSDSTVVLSEFQYNHLVNINDTTLYLIKDDGVQN